MNDITMTLTSVTRPREIRVRARKLAAALREAHPRATERLLSRVGIAEAILQHRDRLSASRPGEVLVTKTNGGGVPASYSYRAETDELIIETPHNDATTLTVDRVTASAPLVNGIYTRAVQTEIPEGRKSAPFRKITWTPR